MQWLHPFKASQHQPMAVTVASSLARIGFTRGVWSKKKNDASIGSIFVSRPLIFSWPALMPDVDLVNLLIRTVFTVL
jgi:hypothetical protein